MKTAIECIPCFVRQASEAVELCGIPHEKREKLLRKLLRQLSDSSWDALPAEVSQKIQRTIFEDTGLVDPYKKVKDQMNEMALGLLPELRKAIALQANPQEAALRISLTGNLLDSGAQNRLDHNTMPAYLKQVWDAPLAGDSQLLFDTAELSENILFLADNAGEIVFDKLLLEVLPLAQVTVAVRGKPVINDVTYEDAEKVGITQLAPVISNGSGAPGTILEECTDEFKDYFEKADLIISKGQGNFETLHSTHKRIFFLLTVKCPMIAEAIGAPVGTMTVAARNL
ncbi:MAG: DUF89 family protein [Lentisphaerae bacterium]|nr:DUF89 family protein [Lentisphaerota bacterium]